MDKDDVLVLFILVALVVFWVSVMGIILSWDDDPGWEEIPPPSDRYEECFAWEGEGYEGVFCLEAEPTDTR